MATNLWQDLSSRQVTAKRNTRQDGEARQRRGRPPRPDAHCTRAEWRRYMLDEYAYRNGSHDA